MAPVQMVQAPVVPAMVAANLVQASPAGAVSAEQLAVAVAMAIQKKG